MINLFCLSNSPWKSIQNETLLTWWLFNGFINYPNDQIIRDQFSLKNATSKNNYYLKENPKKNLFPEPFIFFFKKNDLFHGLFSFDPKRGLSSNSSSQHITSGQVTQTILILDEWRLCAFSRAWWACNSIISTIFIIHWLAWTVVDVKM